MKIFQRAILLGLFIAAGVGIALGLVFSSDASSTSASNRISSLPDADTATKDRSKNNLPAPHLENDGRREAQPEKTATYSSVGPKTNDPKTNTVEKPAAEAQSDSSPSPVIVLPNPRFADPKAQSAAQQPPAPDTVRQTDESLNIGNLAPQSGAGLLLQQAAKLLGQAANNNASRKEHQTAALLEQIPAGTQSETSGGQFVTQNQHNGLKVTKVDGNERLSINIQNADIREVLDLIGQQGNLNILTSAKVQGSVSATLSDVDLNGALDAILKSAGLMARREGNFIFVGNNNDFETMERSMDRITTRVYRPNYIQAAELETLIKPVLTQGMPGAGVVSKTTPSDIGIQSDGTSAGGDTYAGTEAVVVRDFEAVLAEIDQLVLEIDVRPTQVQIEAMILSVELSDNFEFGVSFEVLRQFPHLRFGWGAPQDSFKDFKYDGGVKVAFLDDTLGAFVEALETVGDTNVIGTPRLLVVNKHRAEIQVGESRGYVNTTQTETARTQSVDFLELGILLRIRPFISSDGVIRMEVHPEISDGEVDVEQGFTLPNKQVTQVTTNVMVHDGCTVVIGGLLKEELKTDRTQVPLLGSLPVVGVAFRTKTEVMKRRELIVLLTPHIVNEPGLCEEGHEAACEFHRRQEVVHEKTSPLGKRSLARRYVRKAQQAWAMGDRHRAMRLAEMAVNFDPQNRMAIDLRSNIWMGRRIGKHTLPPESDSPPLHNPSQNPLDSGQVAPWILDGLGSQAAGSGEHRQQMMPMQMNSMPAEAEPQHPIDPGRPGRRINLNRPEKLYPLSSSALEVAQ